MKAKKYFVSILLLVLFCFTFTGCFTTMWLFGLFDDDDDDVELTVDDKITVDTGVMQNVVKITGDGLEKSHLAVSPDGKSLLYMQKTENSSVWELILLKDALSPARTPLGIRDLDSLGWYNDSKTFIYSGLDGTEEKLIRSSTAGGGKTYITRNTIGTADGWPRIKKNKILCHTKISGTIQIVCLNDNGTEITILVEGKQPFWHPTENKFVFVQNDNAICEMDLNSYQVTELYSDKDSKFFSPTYSIDGKFIVFTQYGSVNISANGGKKSQVVNRHHLFLINSDGTNRTQLTSGNVNTMYPSWGQNNELFFISDVGGKDEIWKATVRKTN